MAEESRGWHSLEVVPAQHDLQASEWLVPPTHLVGDVLQVFKHLSAHHADFVDDQHLHMHHQALSPNELIPQSLGKAGIASTSSIKVVIFAYLRAVSASVWGVTISIVNCTAAA